MNLQYNIHQLLKELGPGRMVSTAYDTAWVARLAEKGEPMGLQALEWLRANQLPDGSWGASPPRYYHDRLICTLAAAIAIARRGEDQDKNRLRRAQRALENIAKALFLDPAGETIGFEMIVPTLIAEAQGLGLIPHRFNGFPNSLAHQRTTKLLSLPNGTVNRYVTLAFSAEMVGFDGAHLLEAENLQESNGSVGHSPSATAYFLLHETEQGMAGLEYLREIANSDGGVPNVAPFDLFEQAWGLWNLALTGTLDDETLALCQTHLDFIESAWRPGLGVAFAAGYTPTDADSTSVVHRVLTHFGRPVDQDAFRIYEGDDYFRTFPVEANASLSTNVHTLCALQEAGFEIEHPSVQKILQFLRRKQLLDLYWIDKWHASPYYPTSRAVIGCVGYDSRLIAGTIQWILETQHAKGSWGYYVPTAEETAYCLQTLAIWKQNGGSVPADALKRGATWLAAHADPPYPPLWIGKCLYCPELVVRSAVLSALKLVEEEL